MDGRENSVSDWLSIQNFNMDIYNKQVFSSVSSVHVPQFVLEYLFMDSYKIEDNSQKSEKTEKKQLKIKIKRVKSMEGQVVNILIPLKSLSIFALGTNVEDYLHLGYD